MDRRTTHPARGSWRGLGGGRVRAAVAAALGLALVATSGGGVGAQEGEPSRAAAVVGALVPQPERYFTHTGSSAPNVITDEDLARVAGIPVRQHPVNAGVFDTGCAQCHRLSGPLPPGSGAPPDVFDGLPAVALDTPVPSGFTRLTTSPAREEVPSWRPDGGAILYEARDDGGRYNLWLVGADGAGPRRLTDHEAAGWGVWRPDGARIAYWASDEPGRGDLWLLDPQTGASRRLTDHRMTAWPQWSPDGTRLAFQARDEGPWRLRLLDVASGSERDLTQPADALPSRPLWSPDGTELLYQSLVGTRFELTRLVFPLAADGRPDYDAAPRRVAVTTVYPIDLGAATERPAWNPAGDRLAFVMYTLQVVPPGALAFSYKTWTLSPNGAHPRLLVPSGTIADRSPTWSPDGAWIAQWSWNRDLRAAVWLIDAQGSRRVDLTAALGGDALYPAWSPDGTRLAFAADRGGSFDIWLADVPARLVAEAARASP